MILIFIRDVNMGMISNLHPWFCFWVDSLFRSWFTPVFWRVLLLSLSSYLLAVPFSMLRCIHHLLSVCFVSWVIHLLVCVICQ